MSFGRKTLAALAVTLCFLATSALAQTWPDKPVRVIVAGGAGGTADLLARLLGERLSASLGQPFIYDNRTGAGGMVAAEAVARAAADGYTLLLSGLPTHSVGPHLYKDLKFDPNRDVPSLAMIAVAPNVLVVNANSPVRSVQDLVRMARETPGKLAFSSAGSATSGHLAGELFKSVAKVDMLHVPNRSGPEAVTALLSGSVDFLFFTTPATLPHVRAGRMRALGVTSLTRSALAPEFPTLAESGYPDFEVVPWYAVGAPRGVPAAVLSRLNGEIEKAIAHPEARAKVLSLGAEPRFMSGQALQDFVANDLAKWGRIIRATGSKAD